MPQGMIAQFGIWLGDIQNLQYLLLAAGFLLLGLWYFAARWRRGLIMLRGDLAAEKQKRAESEQRGEKAAAELRALEMRAGQQDVRLDEQRNRLAELTGECDGLTDALHQSRQQIAGLQTESAEIRLGAAKDREAAMREIATLRELRAEMTAQFKLMSNETLRTQAADLQKAQGEQLSSMLTPFRDQVHRFQTELQSRNKVLDEEGARLREQIASLHKRSEEISREAVNLTRALKGDKQRQGAWGEMVLERILETSGLEAGTHYEIQSSWRDEDGRRWRPDVIVRMPQKKALIIDSKVSLNDFEAFVNSEDPVLAKAALTRHVAAVRNHVTTLAAKGYHRLDDNSVDYVLMFIPIEGAFSEAMRADPELANFALDHGIGLTTPTTLMLTLRTVDHIWAVERRESNATEIARRAGHLYDKVVGFAEALETVGKSLEGALKAHNQATDRLARGPGNVIRQVEILRSLGARTQKKITMDHDDDDDPAFPEIPAASNNLVK